MHLTKLFRGWHIIALCLPLASVSQDVQWEKSYGGRHADYLFDAVPTADYGFILAGSSLSGKTGNKASSNKGNLDYWVWKMDEKGEPVWQKSFGGSGIDLLHSVRLTNDGGFLLAGTSDSPKSDDKKENTHGGRDFWVIKLDAGGGERWQKTLGGLSDEELVGVAVSKDGGCLLAGSTYSDASGDVTQKNKGGLDFWLVRLDYEGNVKWQKTLGGALSDEMRSVIATADGGYLVGGTSNSPEGFDKTSKCNGGSDFWILKLDKDGNIEWQRTMGAEKDDQLQSLWQTHDGGYIASGNSNSGAGFNKTSASRGGSDFWVVRLDPSGNPLWQETYNFGKYDVLTSLVENADGTLLIAGTAKSESVVNKDKEGTNDYIALKTDAEGKELWSRTIGSEGEDMLRKLIETRDGGYLLAGTSNPEAVKPGKRKKNKNGLNAISNGGRLAAAENAQREMDRNVAQGRDAANDFYKEQTASASKAVSDALEQQEGSPLKMGIGAPGDLLQSGNGSGGKKGSSRDTNPPNAKKLPASRQKSNNPGRSDFWVVKLKDKDKKEKAKQNVEAFPNPAHDYTNVVVGYEYEKGTATVFDINGRQLQSFAITERTVPVSLEGFPEGIYIINIRTDKSNDSVKVMKASRKN